MIAMGIVIKKYGDLTTPTPAYGGRVWGTPLSRYGERDGRR